MNICDKKGMPKGRRGERIAMREAVNTKVNKETTGDTQRVTARQRKTHRE